MQFIFILLLSLNTTLALSSVEDHLCRALHEAIARDSAPDYESVRNKFDRDGTPYPEDFFKDIFMDVEGDFRAYSKTEPHAAMAKCKASYQENESLKSAPETILGTDEDISDQETVRAEEGTNLFSQRKRSYRNTPANFVSTEKEDDCASLKALEACEDNSSEHNKLSYTWKSIVDKFENFGSEKKKACACLDKKLNIAYGKEGGIRKKDEVILKNKLHATLLKKFGEKFLNDYAANIEDISNYNTNHSTFFGSNSSDQEKKAKLLQCSDHKRYEHAIHKKCRKRDFYESQKRVFNIFRAHGDTNMLDMEAKFIRLNHNISVLGGRTKNSENKAYTRYNHDKLRYSLFLDEPTNGFMDLLVRKALSDQRIIDAFATSSKTPFEILSKELSAITLKNPNEFNEKFLKGENVPDGFKAQFINFANTPDHSNIFEKYLKRAMELHPGFENLMLDKKLLSDVLPKLKAGQSLTSYIEKPNPELEAKFHHRCEKLINDLAEVVCMDSDDLLAKITPAQLKKIMPAVRDEKSKDLAKYLMCKSEPSLPSPAFENLFMQDKSQKKSDYLDRKLNSIEKQTNLFRTIYNDFENNNENEIERYRDAMKKAEGKSSSITSSSLASTAFGSNLHSSVFSDAGIMEPGRNKGSSDLTPGMDSLARQSPSDINTDTKDISTSMGNTHSGQVASAESNQMYSQASQQMMNAAAAPASFINPGFANVPQAATQASANADKGMKDLRKEFREFLANETNKDAVDKHLSNADPAMLKDLQRLRDEFAKNEKRLIELTKENDKMKLGELEKQIKGLEDQKSKVLSEVSENEEGPRSRGFSNLREARRDIASVSQVAETGGVTSGASSASAGSAQSGSDSGASAERANVSKGAISQAAVASQAIGGGGDSFSAVIISSGRSQSGPNQEVRSQDLSLEVMSYLEKGSPDINTLLKMKNSGMVYKYKVVENGKVIEKEMMIDYQSLTPQVKQIIEQKIAAKGIDAKELDRLENDIKRLKRQYTYNSLRVILSEQMKQ